MSLWSSMLPNIHRSLVNLSVVAVLSLGVGEAWAIGDSGGCTFDSEFARKMAFGTVEDVEQFIAERMSGYLEYLIRQNSAPFREDPKALNEWRNKFRKQKLFDKVGCSHGEYPLDYAVSNGNLDVVRWLLDMGVDPNALTSSIGGAKSVFSRCGLPGRISGRPDGLSKEQVRQRVIDAYRMLLARGADINDPNLFDSTYGCISTEMHPILKQLGARVSAKAFQSWASYRDWAVVQELAKDEKFDFRGTEFEYQLLRNAESSVDESDYKSIMALIQRLSSIVRLSPGITPRQPAKPSDVPGGFSPVREQCYFPEISAYPNFDLLTLVRTSKADAPGGAERDVTEILVGKTKEPVILALHNDRDTPTRWVVHRAKDANILGVIVLRGRRGGNDVVSFDPSRPIFFGFHSECGLDYDSKIVDKRWVGLSGFRLLNPKGQNPATRTFNPFVLRGVPPIASSFDDQFTVGDVSSSQTWVSWPDIARTEAKPLAEEYGHERQGVLFTEKDRQKSRLDDQERYRARIAHSDAAHRLVVKGRLIDARADYAAAIAVPLAEGLLRASDERVKQYIEERLKDLEARILRVDRAVEAHTKKIRRGDGSAQTLVQRGLAYIDNVDYGRGLEDLDRAGERLSGVENVAVSRAWGYFRANEIGQAKSAARQILAEYSGNGDALSLLAWCGLLEGNAGEANANALQAMKRGTHFVMGSSSRAYALIAAYFSERALRGTAAGEAVLKKYQGDAGGGPWPRLALQYLAGAVSESEMLGETESLRAKDSGNSYAEAVVFVTINSAFSSDWDTSRDRMHGLLNHRYRPTYPLAYRLIMNLSIKEPLRIVVGREPQ